ncbi:MAG: sigma-70 family RNA polymerase sigma factor [Bacteroidales bacterium]|nr:sigma-70 family RNA polymerase sigma factor [Bacteroidales bacterium]
MPHSETLFRIAFRYLLDKAQAEDIVQEVYVKLWEKRKSLGDVKSVKAFAITMTKNAALDKIRLQKKNVDVDHLSNEQINDDNYDNKERYLVAKEIISKLPPQQKNVIEMRDIDGLEFDEIAQALKMEPNTIRANLSLARKKVREEFKKVYSYGLQRN